MSGGMSMEGDLGDRNEVQVIYELPVSRIVIPSDRARGLDQAWVGALAKVIEAQGLTNPITVREIQGEYVLVSGAHRLAAFQELGYEMIPARMSSAVNDDAARLEEVLENLARHELQAFDRCHHLYELKQVYERLYPETKAGVAGALAKHGSANEIFAFAESAAEATGLSRRSIELAVSIWRGLSEASKARIVGTDVARKQSDLRALAVEDETIQHRALNLYFEGSAASTIADAITLARGGPLEPVPDKIYRTVEGNWQRFNLKQKRAFIALHREEILTLLSDTDATSETCEVSETEEVGGISEVEAA